MITTTKHALPEVRHVLFSAILICTYFFLAFTFQDTPVQIFLAGDSTMSVKDPAKYPETGWGMPFAGFWKPAVTVHNRAVNGRSTKSFIAEGRWQAILDDLRAGDYVFIQFGHNDEAITKGERYTTPEQYRANLERFVSDVRAADAHPILLTPVGRRKFDDQGKVVQTHPERSPIVREVARELAVPLIDADLLSQELYQELGPETSKLLFLQLAPGEHPNYPNGVDDNTHFNELGARMIAQMVLGELRTLQPELAQHVVNAE